MNRSPFHLGEQKVQTLLGVHQSIEPFARQVVRTYLPPQHRDFYAQLPFIVVAARDAAGRPWASLLCGRPGFTHSPDERHLRINRSGLPGDALEHALQAGTKLGLLGIELETRRRNRVNGVIEQITPTGLHFEVDQAFGNCPQYITEREWEYVESSGEMPQPVRQHQLDAPMRELINTADTMFIASGYEGDGKPDERYGMDASHRGGPPGFVQALDAQHLVFPDYSGNNHFNTIGNLVLDPRVGLLFVDFKRGSLLQLSGEAQIDWNSEEIASYPGAQRLIRVNVQEVVYQRGVLPLRWSEPDTSALTLQVARKQQESEDVSSFYLVAKNNHPLPEFAAGQHLSIELKLPSQPHPVKRSYSLSKPPGLGYYRISVKCHGKGLASRWLHEHIHEGDLIIAHPPAGGFVLQTTARPSVLISAGIGSTPMVSMLHQHCREHPEQPVFFIHGARDRAHHPLATEVRQLAKHHPNMSLDVSYSQPRPDDIKGKDFDHQGRVTSLHVVNILPTLEADFYICGPPSFMAEISTGLEQHGVDARQIRTETFGPV